MPSDRHWTERYPKLPAAISGALSLFSVVVSVLSTFRKDPYWITLIAAFFGLVSFVVFCAYLILAKSGPLVAGGHGVYLFPDGRKLGILGVLLASGVTAYMFSAPSGKDFMRTAWFGTETLTPTMEPATVTPASVAVLPATTTPTPVSSATPPPYQKALPSATATPLGGSAELAFVSNFQGLESVYLYSLQQGHPVELTRSIGSAGLAWSWDRSKLAFAANRGEGLQIYVIDLATGQTDRITSDENRVHSKPSWSPSGEQIAYVAGIADKPYTYDVYIYDIPTRATLRVINDAGDDVDVDWSADDTYLLYVSWARGSADIYKYELASNRRALLIATGASETGPQLSRLGKYMAYTEGQPGGGFGIVVYDMVQDQVVRRIVQENVVLDRASWSPDEQWIAMTCQYSRNDANTREICIANVSNGFFRRITFNVAYDDWPAWSP